MSSSPYIAPLLQFQVVSDLHLEMIPRDIPINTKLPPPLTPLLVLAGDVYVGRDTERFADIMSFIGKRYQHVIYVPGNHEYYGTRSITFPMENVRESIRNICHNIPNIHFLDNATIMVNGIKFMGATMWTNIPESEFPFTAFKMADYSVIGMRSGDNGDETRSLSPEDINAIHQASKNFFETEIRTPDTAMAQITIDTPPSHKPYVVAVTHHAPSQRYLGNWFRGDEYKPFYFATDLDELLQNPPLIAWLHGHTHSSVNDISAGGTRIIANPRGYDAPDFQEINPLYDPCQIVNVYPSGTIQVRSTTKLKSRST